MMRFAITLALVVSVAGNPANAESQICDRCILSVLQTEPCDAKCESVGGESIPIREGLARLAQFLERSALGEPHALLFLNIVHRWFGGVRFADTLTRYDRALVAQPGQAHVLRLFRRLMDRDSPLDTQDLAKLTTDFDPMTAHALHCDRMKLGADYARSLRDAASQGGYPLAHAALAWAWLEENRCSLKPNLPSDFEATLVRDMVALIDLTEPVIDLEIEAAALLHAMGHGHRVPAGFIGRVLAAQAPSGGFRLTSSSTEKPNFHTSMLAFWLLLQHACPSKNKRPMIAGPDAR